MNKRGAWSLLGLWLAVSVVLMGGREADASRMYTYTDDRGTFVATDSLENVPPKYRARVKELAVQDSRPHALVQPIRPPEIGPPSRASLESPVSGLVDRFPKSLTIPGLTPGQSMGAIGGVLVGALAIVAMLLSGNPFAQVSAKLLLKFLVPAVLVGAITVLYFSYLISVSDPTAPGANQGTSSVDVFQKARESVKAQEAAHQQRMKTIDSLSGPTEP